MEQSKWMWMVWLLVAIEVAIIWITNHLGVWYVTFAISVANGVIIQRTRTSLWASCVACVGGWGLALGWQTLISPVGPTSELISKIMGFGAHGFIVVLLTLILPFLFAIIGVWLAKSLQSIMPVRKRISATLTSGESSERAH